MNFSVAAARTRLGVELVFARQIHDRKKEVAHFVRDRAGSPDAMASFASPSSSSTFATTSSISLQSKPTRAAFVCAFCASISAGKALVRPLK